MSGGTRRRPTVALATSRDWPRLPPDEVGLVPALERLGLDVAVVIWTEPAVAWERFDAIVIRSCWDYHDDLAAWFSWLDRLGRGGAGARLHNPAGALRWNARKSYLQALSAHGIPTVPTLWLDGDALASPAAAVAGLQTAARAGWDELVAKPAVSAGALGTLRLRRELLDGPDATSLVEEVLPAWRQRAPVLVQPFLHAVTAEGEWSLLFFDGRLSHAVLKQPAPGDFRVQERHGGTATCPVPPPRVVTAAEEMLRVALPLALGAGAAPLLYARVDLVVVAGAPLLMELEIIEPALFLQQSPGGSGADAFARALAARL